MACNIPQKLILLSTQTASNSASLAFTSVIVPQYNVYYVEVLGLVPATDATTLLLTFSIDNGSNYLATNYMWSKETLASNADYTNTVSASDSSINLLTLCSNSSTRVGVGGFLNLYNLAQAFPAICEGNMSNYNSDNVALNADVGGMNTGTTAVTAIKFAMSSGNITSGTINLYAVVI